MNNLKQAEQELLDVVLNSGLTSAELRKLSSYCEDLLDNIVIKPDVQFDSRIEKYSDTCRKEN